MALSFQVTFDAGDPPSLARFWATALDYIEQPPPPGHDTWEDFARAVGIPEDDWDKLAAVVDPAGDGPRVLFQKVPEGKTAKNRVHLDVNVAGRDTADEDRQRLVNEKVDQLVAAGATEVRRFSEREYWVVMQDPEGNEFCVQ